jgi:hypothetical protein
MKLFSVGIVLFACACWVAALVFAMLCAAASDVALPVAAALIAGMLA